MRTIVKTMLAATSLTAAGLAVTACQPSVSASGSGSASGTASASVAATHGSGSGAKNCQSANLKASFAIQNPDETFVGINLKNTGPVCVLNGFPSVDASGTANREPIAIPVAHDNESHQKVTLNPGQYAQFVINYSKAGTDPGTQFGLSSLTITPPNADGSLPPLKVPDGVFPPLDFNGNTTDQLPGTTVTPITTGPSDPQP